MLSDLSRRVAIRPFLWCGKWKFASRFHSAQRCACSRHAMNGSLRLATFVAAVWIACAMPVCAQTLPFYSVDSIKAACMEYVEKQATKKRRVSPETVCAIHTGMNASALQDLARRWTSINSSIRMQCITAKQVANYSALRECIEILEKRRPSSPGRR